MLKRLAKYNMKCHYCISDENGCEDQKEHEEYQYLNLIHDILENGVTDKGRNGVTKSIFGASMIFSLSDGRIPILTTKRTAWKTCLKELENSFRQCFEERRFFIGIPVKEWMKWSSLKLKVTCTIWSLNISSIKKQGTRGLNLKMKIFIKNHY